MAGVGYFGKIAALGDFVRRDLPRGFAEVWDPWVQEGLTASRAILGPAWFDHYQVAPPWRFALAPGLCGPAGLVGTLMPSMDRVGRLFPLTLLAERPADRLAAAFADHAALHAMEEAALDTLDPTGGREAFDKAVDALAVPDGPPGEDLRGSLWLCHVDGAETSFRHGSLPPPESFATFLDLSPAHWTGAAA